MPQDNQTATRRARSSRTTPKEPGTNPDAGGAVPTLPEAVTVAVSELAGELEAGTGKESCSPSSMRMLWR